MIELVKEKCFQSKDQKLQMVKQTILFNKFSIPKFTCSCPSSITNDNKMVIYLGMSNGNIIAMTLFKQKSVRMN